MTHSVKGGCVETWKILGRIHQQKSVLSATSFLLMAFETILFIHFSFHEHSKYGSRSAVAATNYV